MTGSLTSPGGSLISSGFARGVRISSWLIWLLSEGVLSGFPCRVWSVLCVELGLCNLSLEFSLAHVVVAESSFG